MMLDEVAARGFGICQRKSFSRVGIVCTVALAVGVADDPMAFLKHEDGDAFPVFVVLVTRSTIACANTIAREQTHDATRANVRGEHA